MGKVIAPLHSVQVRGKVGGVMFRRWRNINTASGLTGGTGAPTESHFVDWKTACASWKDLTFEQMEAWRQYAAKTPTGGGPFSPTHRSGYMTYVLAAYLADQCGESYPTLPPTTLPPSYPGITSLDDDGAGNLLVEWDSTGDADYIQIKGLINAPLSKRIFDNQLKELYIVAIATGEQDLGVIVADRLFRVRLRRVRDSGQAGPWEYGDYES